MVDGRVETQRRLFAARRRRSTVDAGRGNWSSNARLAVS